MGWGKSKPEPGWVEGKLGRKLSKSDQKLRGGGALRGEVSH